MESKRSNLGAYFLCNDVKIDWAYAFLASFREFNPTMPLTLIPFDQRIQKLCGLSREFSFDILESDWSGALPELSVPVYQRPEHTLRKMAVFSGIYDHFFYLDSDIVVTSDLEPLAQRSIESQFDLVYFDTDINMVYRPGPLRDEMVGKYQTKAFNTGCWFSRRGLLDLGKMKALADELEPVKKQLVPIGEQPFFNYFCDKSAFRLGLFSDVMPEFFRENWYRHVHPRKVAGRWIEGCGEKAGRPICLIHFAGQTNPGPSMACYWIYLAYRTKCEGAFRTQLWNVRAHLRFWPRFILIKIKKGLKALLP